VIRSFRVRMQRCGDVQGAKTSSKMTLNVKTFNLTALNIVDKLRHPCRLFWYADCRCAICHYDECHCPNCRCSNCNCPNCHCAKCHHAMSYYAECHSVCHVKLDSHCLIFKSLRKLKLLARDKHASLFISCVKNEY
jgi:hypothetical protein